MHVHKTADDSWGRLLHFQFAFRNQVTYLLTYLLSQFLPDPLLFALSRGLGTPTT